MQDQKGSPALSSQYSLKNPLETGFFCYVYIVETRILISDMILAVCKREQSISNSPHLLEMSLIRETTFLSLQSLMENLLWHSQPITVSIY